MVSGGSTGPKQKGGNVSGVWGSVIWVPGSSYCVVFKVGTEPLGSGERVNQASEEQYFFSVPGTIKDDKDISSVASFILRF